MAKGQDYFQKHSINHIDYKDIRTLKKFITKVFRRYNVTEAAIIAAIQGLPAHKWSGTAS